MNTLLDKMKRVLGKTGKKDAKSFKENQAQEAAFDHIERGILTVPLDRIVGSVGRYNDFDDRFKLKEHMPPDRLISIKNAMREGKPLPPVKLYKIKDEYYVLDGNHRISAAKALEHIDIRAKIVEFIPSSNTLENIIYREKSQFLEKTGLSHTFELTEVGQYSYFISQIKDHQSFLEKSQCCDVSFQKASRDWFETVYLPMVSIIKKGRLLPSFPGRTVDDLFAYISFHQWEKGRRRTYGIGIDKLIPRDMEAFRKKMSAIKKEDYPEMLRGITTFIMMNVDARRELKIVDKLFVQPEVKEVHAVHGSIDILVKIELTRDLLCSDAEIIGQFVHHHIRQIPGVISTQTLIPGTSRIK